MTAKSGLAAAPAGKEKATGGPGTILDHADDYSGFISSDPAFENLWIYTRAPHVDPATLKTLIGKARSMGYDVSKLEFPAQP